MNFAVGQMTPPPELRRTPLVEVRPQGKVERHAGIGFELVAALDAPVPQMVEQLVEVPAEPVFVEQTIDIPVPGGGERLRLQGFLPEQSSTACGGGGPCGFPAGQVSTV